MTRIGNQNNNLVVFFSPLAFIFSFPQLIPRTAPTGSYMCEYVYIRLDCTLQHTMKESCIDFQIILRCVNFFKTHLHIDLSARFLTFYTQDMF